MGRSPSGDDESGLKKGPWTAEEDSILVDYINKNGHGSWRALPKIAGLNRCGKSCRLRWTNYLRPDIKRGKFSEEEEKLIINLHQLLGNKWSAIASHLPGRTDNEIKNFWNTNLRKKLLQMGLDPVTHRPRLDHNHNQLQLLSNLQHLLLAANILSNNNNNNALFSSLLINSDHAITQQQLAKIQFLQNMLQILATNNNLAPNLEPLLNHQQFGPLTSSSSSSSVPNGFYESLGLNESMLQNLICSNDSFPCQNQPNFQNFEAPQHNMNGGSCMMKSENVNNNNNEKVVVDGTNSSSPTTPLNYYSLPNLVSASSPDHECSNKVNNNNQNNDDCYNNNNNNSPTSTNNFEMWADFMYEEASDAYWKHIIDQESNHP